jgi:hypothetical protein
VRSRRNSATPGLVALVKERCPHFLVAFVTHGERVVRAIESVTSLPLRAAASRPSTLLMRAIPQRHPVAEAHSCLIQSPSRAITTDIGEIRTYSHCEIE